MRLCFGLKRKGIILCGFKAIRSLALLVRSDGVWHSASRSTRRAVYIGVVDGWISFRRRRFNSRRWSRLHVSSLSGDRRRGLVTRTPQPMGAGGVSTGCESSVARLGHISPFGLLSEADRNEKWAGPGDYSGSFWATSSNEPFDSIYLFIFTSRLEAHDNMTSDTTH